MKVTPSRRGKRCNREHSALEEPEADMEQLVESVGGDLSEFLYPFENNVEFVDNSPEETEESSRSSEFEEQDILSVPATPPSTPMSKPDRTESSVATAGPARDRRPSAVSRRAWHKLRRMVEGQERPLEEAEQDNLYDKVTGRRDQSREAQEARSELCCEVRKEGSQHPVESATATLQSTSRSSKPLLPEARCLISVHQGEEANKELEKEVSSATAPDEPLQQPTEGEFSSEATSISKRAAIQPNEDMPNAEEEARESSPMRKSVVSWHPVAEVVTVEAGSPTTQYPVTRSTTGLVEKSTLRSCRRITDRSSV
ncbi:hypothetical protein, conserved [Eimeria maxima]|uniref:Uncharacterized protein n=1 Tax=Eimeria maxima TaxID=5804 RepID=U6MCC2_EIMMA|nr:hypothetical protein, conserved [Eimeria maxima]CDJ61666.1 hypothetical protein, conserved [Eimeria maxima]